ncbi:hypothetical protein WJX81_006257 [Elliptochloris bilobata]|uniref:Uncharacterized protein n=1 Tax=Elliptochloris bilobata TaxID=381761 RepID=A0AAW1S5Y7_9CHLO
MSLPCRVNSHELAGKEAAETLEDDELQIEKQIRGRRTPRKKEGPTVLAPQVQQAYSGAPQTPAGQAETLAVRGLGVFFLLIVSEGLFLALSGFLPESLDGFAEATVYPSFSPTVGIFLLCSALYGLWKSRQ